ncbi:hypothetical protein ACF0H5_018811 [Mactra antiquata]
MYPDPIPADGRQATPTRPPPKRRCIDHGHEKFIATKIENKENESATLHSLETNNIPWMESEPLYQESSCQTDILSKVVRYEF